MISNDIEKIIIQLHTGNLINITLENPHDAILKLYNQIIENKKSIKRYTIQKGNIFIEKQLDKKDTSYNYYLIDKDLRIVCFESLEEKYQFKYSSIEIILDKDIERFSHKVFIKYKKSSNLMSINDFIQMINMTYKFDSTPSPEFGIAVRKLCISTDNSYTLLLDKRYKQDSKEYIYKLLLNSSKVEE